MARLRWISLFVGLACVLSVNAQSDDDQAKEKERQKLLLAESIWGDIGQLALEENRAVALARLGNSLWSLDEKRARGFFHEAVGELLSAQAAAEASRRSGQHNELLTGQSTRPQILHAIAQRDADLALQSLYKTRPAAIQRAMLSADSKDRKIPNSPGSDTHLRQAESNLEQALMRQAAEQNPARAVELIKKALKTALSGETLNLLKKIHEKEPQTAKELASEAVAKLLKKSLMIDNHADYQSFQVSISFLQDSIRERPKRDTGFRFDDSEMRQLVEKIIAFYLEKGGILGFGHGYQLIPLAEKLMPSAVERLKQVDKNAFRHGVHVGHADETTARLLSSETPIEEVLTQAPKLSTESRRQVYQHVANRMAAEGNFDRARSVLSDNFSEDGLENVMSSLNWNHLHYLINHERFAEAEGLIDQFPDSNRHAALVSLASTMFGRDPKNRSYAVNLLEKSRAQLPEKPVTNMEMSHLMQIANAYSTIEPAEAYRMLERLVPTINELMEAAVIVHGFQGSYNIRRGEIPVSQANSLGVHFETSLFRNLAKSDLDRTMGLIGSFARREIRLTLKQQLLDSL